MIYLKEVITPLKKMVFFKDKLFGLNANKREKSHNN